MSPGEQLIDMVYVDDVVDAFMCAASLLLSDKITGVQCYDVSSRKPIKLKQLAEIFQRVAGKPLSIEWGGRPYRDREIMVPWTGGNRLPGWEPQVKLEKGIKKTLMAKKA